MFMTQLESAVAGIITKEMAIVAEKEHPDFICVVSELTESQDMQNTVYELMSGYSKVR